MQAWVAKRVTKMTGAAAAVVLAASLANGCSPAANEVTGNTAAGDKPVEIEIMTDLTLEKPSMTNEYWSEFQKLTNSKMNIIWVPGSEYTTKLDLVLASGDIPEVIYGGDHNRPTLINAIRHGAFWDLTPFLGDFSEYPNLRDHMTPGSWNYVKVDGKIMGVPRSRSLIDSGLKMRKDWLEKLGLPVPATIDEYRDTLIKIVKGDPDGNGKNDTIGLAVGAQPDTSLQAAFGVFKPTHDAAGGLVYSSLTPQYTQLIEWLRGLYAEGVLPAEFAALNATQLQDLIRSGRAASYHYAIYRDFTWTEDIRKVQPGGELITLPPMKGPNGDYAAYLDAGTRGAHHISKKVPEAKVKEILKFLDKTASPEITDLAYYGKEGVHFNVVNGEKVSTELGRQQLNVNTLSPITPAYTQWGKVIAPGAPKEWNEAKKIEVAPYEKLGVVDPFRYLISDTWIEAWPKYDTEMKSMTTKAITGQISMGEYKSYVEKIKSDPQIQKAFQEFAKDLSTRSSGKGE
jgi:putative aldouronate transport system substrate-binding protein